MSALSVFDVPSFNAYYSDPGSLDTLFNLAVRTVNAYRNVDGLAQTLTIGATSNLVLETKEDMNLFSTNGVNLYTTTMSNNTRQDDLIMTIDRSADSNTTIVSSTSTHNLAFTASNEIHFGTAYLDLSGDTDKFKTNKASFEFQNVTVFDCNVHFQSSIITQGSIFGNNLNVWNDTSDAAVNPTDAVQIGYGFRVNDSNQLELIKHVKFNDVEGKVVNQRVAIFGSASNKYTACNDVNYLVFDELDGISVNSNGSITSVTNSPLDNYIFMNDSNVGIGNQFAEYKLDVTGEARVSSTIHAQGGIDLSGHIIPSADVAYDLGDAQHRFRDLYLSGNTIYMADVKLSAENGTFAVRNSTTDQVIVSMDFTDSVSTTDSKIAASATAVKTTYDFAAAISNVAYPASNMAYAASNAASNSYFTTLSFNARINAAESNAASAATFDARIQAASNASSNAYFTVQTFDSRIQAASNASSNAYFTAADVQTTVNSLLTNAALSNVTACNISAIGLTVTGDAYFPEGIICPSLHAQHAISSDGTVTYTNNGFLKWTRFVTLIPLEKSEIATEGHLHISCPADGETIPYYGPGDTITTVSCTTNGIPMSSDIWLGLYYVIDPPQSSSSSSSNFRLVSFQNTLWRPSSNWILIALENNNEWNPVLSWLPGKLQIPRGGIYTHDTDVKSWYDSRYVMSSGGTASLSNVTACNITSLTFSGNGSNITNLHADHIATGTLAVARGGTGVNTSTGSGNLVLSDSPTFTGTMTTSNITASGLISGNGSNITNLHAENIATGTLAVARGGTGVTTSTGSGNLVLSESPTITGTLTTSNVTASGLISGNGSNITNLHAANIATGTLEVARGGTGVTTSTGSGNLVLSGSPTITGTLTTSNITASGTIFGNGLGLTNISAANITPSTGTGSNVLGNSPTITGTLTASNINASGSLGVGITTPQSKMHIIDNGSRVALFESSTSLAPCYVEFKNSLDSRAFLGVDGSGFGGFSNGAFLMATWAAYPLIFATNQQSRMRITPTGNVGIATTNPSYTLDVSGVIHTSSNLLVSSATGRIGVGTTSPSFPLHVTTNVNNVSIQASHDIVAFSDARLKENFQVIDSALDKIDQISGYTYTRKDDPSEKRMAGVIAQEVQAVLPEVVYSTDDDKLAVAYGNLSALLIQSIKELKQKVDSLESALKKA